MIAAVLSAIALQLALQPVSPAGNPIPRDACATRREKTELLFNFDTEDFTDPLAADSVKELAELFTSEGITAHFVMVGYMARALVDWGRHDVIEALRPHLKLSHTLMHSVHPNTSEYSEVEDLREAIRRMRMRETLAVGMVMGATGARKIWGACPPGCSESAGAYYAWAEMGLPFYVGACFAGDNPGDDVWFCNLRQIPYSYCWEEFFDKRRKFDPAAVLDRLARLKRGIVYCHPTKVRSLEFWDELNYKAVNRCKWGEWRISPRRDEAEVREYYRRIRTCLRMIKKDPRFKVVTLKELDGSKKPRRDITPADVPAIRSSLARSFGPVREPASWSLSDCFAAAVVFLRGGKVFSPGMAYGFLTTPRGVAAPVTVKRRDLVSAARSIDTGDFIPSEINVGGAVLGPADFLFAALEAIEGKDDIVVMPKMQRGSFGPYPALEKLSLAGTWLFSEDFRDEYVSEAIRNQIWTLRYE